MVDSVLSPSPAGARTAGRPDDWCRIGFCSAVDTPAVVDRLIEAMARHGFTPRDQFEMRVALEESLDNALRHGEGRRAGRGVRVLFRVTPESALVKVADRGPGFRPDEVPTPAAPDRLHDSRGLGLLLMRSCSTWLRYNRRGNSVTLYKRSSTPRP